MPKNLKKTKGISNQKDAPKKQTKNYKKRLKIEPGGPKMEPECTKSGAKIEKNALNRPKWLPDGSQDPFTQKTRRFLAIFGSPLGAQKSLKIDFFLKKPSQGALFSSIFASNGVFLDFSIDFYLILEEKSMEK